MTHTETPHPILYDERQAAAALGMTPRTMQEWRRTGEGPPFVRISSRCIRYRPNDLVTWAADRLRTSTNDDSTHRR